MVTPVVRSKIREWFARYFPAEVIATGTAVGSAFVAHQASGSLVVAAVVGTVGENIGYYGYFIVLETARHYKAHRHNTPLRRMWLTGFKTARDMIVEFGAAEALDFFIVRPLFMFLGPQLLHHFAWGILAGKLAADVVFYTFAIIGYEFRKRWS